MALKKSIEIPSGFNAEYWRMDPNVSVDFAVGKATASFMLYANEAARRDNKQPLKLPGYTIHLAAVLAGEDFTAALAQGDLRPALYAKAKTHEFFTDAEDC